MSFFSIAYVFLRTSGSVSLIVVGILWHRDSANSAIMRLYLLDQFIEEIIREPDQLRSGEKIWMDRAFENAIIRLTSQTQQAYERMAFRDALKYGFFDMATIRDLYRNLAGQARMHSDCIMRWIESQAVILSPIAPHVSEYIWTIRLKKPSLLVYQLWPTFEKEYDHVLNSEFELLFSSLEEFRKIKEKSLTSSLKHQKASLGQCKRSVAAASLDSAVIYVARDYLPWQQTVLKILQSVPLNDDTQGFPVTSSVISLLKSHPELAQLDKKSMNEVMSFASFKIKVRS